MVEASTDEGVLPVGSDAWEDLAFSLARMSRDLLAQDTVQATLDRIVEQAVKLVDGCEHAGILLLHRKQEVETAAATGELVHKSDQAQGDLGEGPCFDAVEYGQEVYRIPDLSEPVPQWPDYVPKARQLGIGSMMGFLLFTAEDTFGALDLYSTQPHAFTEPSERVGWLVASHAAVAFSSARLNDQWQTAIATRQDIGEALGIVMERYKLTEDQAFAVLKRSSQDRNVKLREIAHQITTTGEIPGAR